MLTDAEVTHTFNNKRATLKTMDKLISHSSKGIGKHNVNQICALYV